MNFLQKLISNFLVILILGGSLLPKGISLSKDFVVSEVISHYLEHRSEANGNLNFGDFLAMHYASDSDHREKNPDKLPNIDGNTTSFFLIFPTNFGDTLATVTYSEFIDLVAANYSNTYCYDFSQEFIHPPIV